MPTLAEIRANPEAYLGRGTPWDYDQFTEAVETLLLDGLDEADAINVVWNGGDWRIVAGAVAICDWLPTHVITTPGGRQYVMLFRGVLYTLAEWVYESPASYEIADYPRLLFRGQPAWDARITRL